MNLGFGNFFTWFKIKEDLEDEIELHLHPKWQRAIISQLLHTFTGCQFIITTHSPQVVGEVKPENI